ncbi:MAG: ABC transporter substrate-binding protein, partial [Gammaproteobacteria bacterium]|nr:ABC transporter substrate-binding protein [Gammaproteobacteria bacterium]
MLKMIKTKISVFALVLVVSCSKPGPETIDLELHETPIEPIKIGVILPFTGYEEGADAEQKGIDLAIALINTRGGLKVNGQHRMIAPFHRDSNLDPTVTLRVAEALINVDQVSLLIGTIGDHIGSAVGSFAEQNKVLFLRPHGFPSRDHEPFQYYFGLNATSESYGEVLADASAAFELKRWAILAPNYEFGQRTAAAFKQQLRSHYPEIEFVYEQFYPLFKLDAGATVQAIKAKDIDGIFTVTFGTDNIKFLREGRARNLFEGVQVVSAIGGLPEELAVTKHETPEGWISLGYPYNEIDNSGHQAFLINFKKTYKEPPKFASLLGYI